MDEKRKRAPGWWSRGAALSIAAAALALGCGTVTIDLGSNHTDAGPIPGDGGGGSSPGTLATCPPLTDSDSARPPCPATCAQAFGAPQAVSSGAELEARVTGRWMTCSGTPPWEVAREGGAPQTSGAVGLEFQAGCTLFVLYDAGDGVVIGGEPDDQGTYDVVETSAGGSVPLSLALHFPTGTWTATAATSDCPYQLQLAIEGASELDFASITTSYSPAM
jgi:hypothetical protein